MMKKMFFMNSMAVLALGLMMGSCSKESVFTQADAVEHAESVLGLNIDPNQDWKMTQEVTANITVNLGSGKEYIVYVFDKSPFDNDDAVYYAKKTVADGTVLSLNLSLPTAATDVYVSVFDNKGKSMSKKVGVFNGTVVAIFGTALPDSNVFTRSMTSPEVLNIDAPYDEAWVAEYLTTAKEPDATNTMDNYDNRTWCEGTEGQWVVDVPSSTVMPTMGNFNWGTLPNTIIYNGEGYWENGQYYTISKEDKDWFEANCRALASFNWNGFDYNSYDDLTRYVTLFLDTYNKCQNSGRSNWINITYDNYHLGSKTEEQGHWQEATEGYWQEDETYVTNFKITGTYDGFINVAGSEGIIDGGKLSGAERTIVVTGTWNINDGEGQRIGSLGKIIIANGGTVNVASGKKLSMVNQARLVVLPGGTLTGDGMVEVSNGNDTGSENYNGGTIDVVTFNNNFGKFYNYGRFLVTEYQGGAKESNFYNHSLAAINQFGGSTANARIFNACQFYVATDARIRNYEGTQGSALIVKGQLMFSSSEDGTGDPTYVGLAAGALVQAGSLYNNGTSWVGPTSGGYAVLNIGQFDYMNWVQDNPAAGGYFANNIYLVADDLSNVPDGNGYQQTDPTDYINYRLSTASYKFSSIVANAVGNGNVKAVTRGSYEVIPADANFVEGESGCTPGFSVNGEPEEEDETEYHEEESQEDFTPVVYSYAFEDSWHGDYDMNDVVVKVRQNADNEGKMDVTLCCTGASYDLSVWLGDYCIFTEVHSSLGGDAGKFINTGGSDSTSDKFETRDPQTITINIPGDSSLGDLDIWIKSPEGDIHVSTNGQDPHGVVIPLDWNWPTEWTRITDAYPDFVGFAADQNTNTDWYKYPASGKTY